MGFLMNLSPLLLRNRKTYLLKYWNLTATCPPTVLIIKTYLRLKVLIQLTPLCLRTPRNLLSLAVMKAMTYPVMCLIFLGKDKEALSMSRKTNLHPSLCCLQTSHHLVHKSPSPPYLLPLLTPSPQCQGPESHPPPAPLPPP